MPLPHDPSTAVLPDAVAPGIETVNKVAAMNSPVLRNLLITQNYFELSNALAKRTGNMANWCSFATWASKQAGETIRSEDLKKTLESTLKGSAEMEESLALFVLLATKLGAAKDIERLRQCSISTMVNEAAKRASEAVNRGNGKVFAEIGFEFARFIVTCLNDDTYREENINAFCAGLRGGKPPDGQEFLQEAFRNYYQLFFETDRKKKAERCLLANLQIGFHEQTRLQPEIAEALNAAISDKDQIRDKLLRIVFENARFLVKLRRFFQRLFGKTSVLEEAAEDLVSLIQARLRLVLTAHLMTLTMPPDLRLQLGKDLSMPYHDDLKTLSNSSLSQLLKQIDPTPNSLLQSGATDWADLGERMHYIADLFRCYHLREEIFNPPFTPEQVMAMTQGLLPQGRL